MWIRKGIRLTVTPGFLFLLAFLCYLDRGVGFLPWALLACAAHEAGHIAAAALLKSRVSYLTLSVVGAELRFQHDKDLSYGEENLLAVAGPAANLLLGLIMYWAGEWLPAILSLGIGGFNLLPIVPLDGGRIMNNILLTRFDVFQSERIMLIIAAILAGVLAGIGAIIAVEYANITLLLSSGWLLARILKSQSGKCK